MEHNGKQSRLPTRPSARATDITALFPRCDRQLLRFGRRSKFFFIFFLFACARSHARLLPPPRLPLSSLSTGEKGGAGGRVVERNRYKFSLDLCES